MVERLDYGLELTNNSKVGWAFSISREMTCINATSICKKLCYGNGIRYRKPSTKAKRDRHFRTVELLLSKGGPRLLAENLIALVDLARPRDWLTAVITESSTNVPWTLRVHDVGDFYSVEYVEAWIETAMARPDCRFWFYTRSFENERVFAALCSLASLSNCQGWLSVDSENFEKAILAKCKASESGWKIALLQDRDLPVDVIPAIESASSAGDVVSFPYHHGGRHVAPIRRESLTLCPSVVGGLALTSRSDIARPCQVCAFCLP